MDNYKPTDLDFRFTSNGYQCGVGVYFPNGDDEREYYHLQMVKQKVAGGDTQSFTDWEPVHVMFYVKQGDWESPVELMSAFLAEANTKLKEMTGGEVPPVPVTFLEQLEHICRYGLAFNPETFEVYLK